MLIRRLFLFITIGLFCNSTIAQQKWDLRKCIDYALANNISIKQTDIQSKISELQYKQSKLSQYPNLNYNLNSSFNSGRNQDPVTYSLITQSYLATNMQLQSSVEIFNWYSKQNTIAANKWEAEAAKATTDKLKDDISLAVANFYLQILLAEEQEKIAGVQLQQSQSQLRNTRKMVDAGSLPELNAAELEAQVARDSATVVSAKGNVEQAVLNLKAYMAMDAATAFDVETPPVEFIPIDDIATLQPESVYTLAVANLPQQRINDLKLKAAVKNTEAAKGRMYPSISAYGSLGSGYANYFNIPNYALVPNGKALTELKADAGGGIEYDIYAPSYSKVKNGTVKSNPLFTQFSDNFRQSVGISISLPIFSGGNLRTGWERNKLTSKNLELQKEADNQKLKQDIYQAYNSAIVALQKFNAAKKTVETSQRSYDFAKKRYDAGMLTTLELITNQNNLLRAKFELIQNQFDYVFKMKVLEFYKGQGLKL
ncbi:TolC family protein [Ferruginibacter sp. SUN002]|uniref:TolC family protein n=1 Tax=Ferruginibacter sp. SUN002 TaxID=2937789 RepID=UPI003D35C907